MKKLFLPILMTSAFFISGHALTADAATTDQTGEAAVANNEAGASQDDSKTAYTVQAGDSLSKIAYNFGTTIEQIGQDNPQIQNYNLIFVGQILTIRGTQSTATVPVVETTGVETGTTTAPVEDTVTETSVTETPAADTSYQAASGRTISMVSTAYSYQQSGLSNYTASGIDLTQNSRVIAVDPSIIPLGSRVYVEGYGEAIAGDTGGDIVGNRIDVHMNSVGECMDWGRRTVNVTVY